MFDPVEESCCDTVTYHYFFQMWMSFQGLHSWSSILGTQNMPKPSLRALSTAIPSGQTFGPSTWTSWSSMAARRKYGELWCSRLGRARAHLKRAEVPCSERLYRASHSTAKGIFSFFHKTGVCGSAYSCWDWGDSKEFRRADGDWFASCGLHDRNRGLALRFTCPSAGIDLYLKGEINFE